MMTGFQQITQTYDWISALTLDLRWQQSIKVGGEESGCTELEYISVSSCKLSVEIFTAPISTLNFVYFLKIVNSPARS